MYDGTFSITDLLRQLLYSCPLPSLSSSRPSREEVSERLEVLRLLRSDTREVKMNNDNFTKAYYKQG